MQVFRLPSLRSGRSGWPHLWCGLWR